MFNRKYYRAVDKWYKELTAIDDALLDLHYSAKVHDVNARVKDIRVKLSHLIIDILIDDL